VLCLFSFVGTAAATLIICTLIPAKPIPEQWHRFAANRNVSSVKGNAKENPKGNARGASAGTN